MKNNIALSFDDVLLVPQKGILNSRKDADLSTTISGIKLQIPIISANMSSVTEGKMILKMAISGGLGILHRMQSIEEMRSILKWIRMHDQSVPIGFSFGIDDTWSLRVAAAFSSGATIACLDVAHAHHKNVIWNVQEFWNVHGARPLIVGNIATPDAALAIAESTPEQFRKLLTLKVGIGGGSLCTTRIQTGFGIPTLQSLMDIKYADYSNYDCGKLQSVSIIADGGIKNSGDIVKAIGAGANAVMIGNLLAGTDETPGNVIKGTDGARYKIYRGSASYGDKQLRGEDPENVEGDEMLIPYKGPVEKVINHLTDGLRSGISYSGYSSLESFRSQAEFVQISQSGLKESLPHGKYSLTI